mmetsp:Transcript_23065/g.58251  ORF Transcript_23065/g.58251 Transcript_23065/m.58251 type:complete len:232 (-) Transcript_23065:699-1394(-)
MPASSMTPSLVMPDTSRPFSPSRKPRRVRNSSSIFSNVAPTSFTSLPVSGAVVADEESAGSTIAFGLLGRSPTVTFRVCFLPPRIISNLFCVLAISLPTSRVVDVASVTLSPFTDRMMSPRARPPFSAGLPLVTSAMIAPLASLMPWASAMSSVRSWMATPSQPRETLPSLIRDLVTSLASSAGIAKPIPTEPPVGEKIAVFTPITLPLRSKVGPPELPRLMEASIWRKSV